jgi:hypothetical protein
MHEEIQDAGANARALGSPQLSNPYYRPKNMPAATGEDVRGWEAKAQAWNLGWEIEDTMRV